ncbi:glutathione S-transferase [Rhodoligotrophos appendicifer]|uniref:glutathione S-transferase N-terminal domain-containing protein n=1 Tax=Rhodoligotrophos appendicifer TaxID=987056 RepID=UPI001185CAF5|nr:glutathione S-transferase N-terminal domain-containing protein [Rhodoligotrophos appendicifer]
MRLLNDATSPFGRKVMMAAIERSIPLSEEFVVLASSEALAKANPLRQIPVLVLDDGSALFDSMTIMTYLDTQHQGAALFPDDRKWSVMTRVSLCDGLMESVLLRVMEVRRPQNEQSPAFIAKLESRIDHALAALDHLLAERDPQDSTLLADDIAAICAMGYVDFRYGTEWREQYPKAAAWSAAYAERPSVVATAPTRTAPATSG